MPIHTLRNVVVPWCRLDVVPTSPEAPDQMVRFVILGLGDACEAHPDGVTVDCTLNEASALLERLRQDFAAIWTEVHG
jgi:hypothetical protein